MTIDTEALAQAWKDAFAHRDANALTNLYHEDGTLLVPRVRADYRPCPGFAR
jgi:ketosteroid isomerase-like protein